MTETMPFPGLQWRPVIGFPDYRVFENGGIQRIEPMISGSCWNVLRQQFNGGYFTVGLTRDRASRRLLVHLIVLNAFIGPKPSLAHEGAHGDGDVSNNWLSNLRWATRSENATDRGRHSPISRRAAIANMAAAEIRQSLAEGKLATPQDVQSPYAKLTIDQVRAIKAELRLDNGPLGKEIAARYGISASLISCMKNGKKWAAIEP